MLADNIEGLDMLDLNWLLDHHKAKAAHRQQVVNALDLNPGDVVIDLGCAPGLCHVCWQKKLLPPARSSVLITMHVSLTMLNANLKTNR